MPDYTDHDVWDVDINGQVSVEANNQDEAIQRAMALLIEGKGSLNSTATLREVFIEVPAP